MNEGREQAGAMEDGVSGAWSVATGIGAYGERPGNDLRCPPPQACAPLVQGGVTQLLPPPARLVGIVRGLIHRDMRAVRGLTPAQLLTQYCITPAASLSWYTAGRGGFVQPHPHDEQRGLWQPMGAEVMVSGVPTAPCTTWMPEPGAGYMVVLWPDALQRVFGLAPDALLGQTDDAFKWLPSHWHAMLAELRAAGGPEQVMAALEHHLVNGQRRALASDGLRLEVMSPGQALEAPESHAELPSDWRAMARQGRAWLAHVALRAMQLGRPQDGAAGTRLSERQIERRIKAFTGQSMRQWKSLIRDEAAFHLAATKASQAQGLNLSDLAFEAGYADQAHMSRVVKRLTGFTPAEFTQRYRTDEGFWLYRLWGG